MSRKVETTGLKNAETSFLCEVENLGRYYSNLSNYFAPLLSTNILLCLSLCSLFVTCNQFLAFTCKLVLRVKSSPCYTVRDLRSRARHQLKSYQPNDPRVVRSSTQPQELTFT
jgi:hypothetical protein